MTKTHEENKAAGAVTTGTATAKRQGNRSPVYSYESAGIAEREGSVPPWLWVVVASLLIWGAYYLVTYWSAPIGPA